MGKYNKFIIINYILFLITLIIDLTTPLTLGTLFWTLATLYLIIISGRDIDYLSFTSVFLFVIAIVLELSDIIGFGWWWIGILLWLLIMGYNQDNCSTQDDNHDPLHPIP